MTANIKVIKDGRILLSQDVPTLLTYLFLAAGTAPSKPYTIEVRAADTIESILVIEADEDES